MEHEKIKKINWLYLIGYIVIPILVMVLGVALTVWHVFPNSGVGTIIFAIFIFGPVVFWSVGGSIIFKNQNKKMETELDRENFHRNQTFNGKGVEVVVDTVDKKVALKFFWNPFEMFIVDAKKIENAYVDTGVSGSGFMEGSSRVSFIFTVDGIKIRVNTFTSNQRFRMDSNYILDGISKADMMVNILNSASKGDKK